MKGKIALGLAGVVGFLSAVPGCVDEGNQEITEEEVAALKLSESVTKSLQEEYGVELLKLAKDADAAKELEAKVCKDDPASVKVSKKLEGIEGHTPIKLMRLLEEMTAEGMYADDSDIAVSNTDNVSVYDCKEQGFNVKLVQNDDHRSLSIELKDLSKEVSRLVVKYEIQMRTEVVSFTAFDAQGDVFLRCEGGIGCFSDRIYDCGDKAAKKVFDYFISRFGFDMKRCQAAKEHKQRVHGVLDEIYAKIREIKLAEVDKNMDVVEKALGVECQPKADENQ